MGDKISEAVENIRHAILHKPVWYRWQGKKHWSVVHKIEAEIAATGYVCFKLLLASGLIAILHTEEDCPQFIGNKCWAFLTESQYDEYWDM